MAEHALAQLVESYRFGELVTLWARERLEHELIVARALSRAIICDGLRLQSVDARWMGTSSATLPGRPLEFHGYPYVGFTARPGRPTSVMRISALNHLIAIVEQAEEPDLSKLQDEFIFREHFYEWLTHYGLPLPRFWFSRG